MILTTLKPLLSFIKDSYPQLILHKKPVIFATLTADSVKFLSSSNALRTLLTKFIHVITYIALKLQNQSILNYMYAVILLNASPKSVNESNLITRNIICQLSVHGMWVKQKQKLNFAVLYFIWTLFVQHIPKSFLSLTSSFFLVHWRILHCTCKIRRNILVFKE